MRIREIPRKARNNQQSFRSTFSLYNRSMDHHTVAAISITGTCLDVLGSLYLAYDLLGGQHGPLRLLTRAVTYSVVFGIGYGLGLGLFFGIASGIATGITLSIEFNRAARGLDHYSLPWKQCFPPSAHLVSELDCTGFWALDSQSHLPFSSQPAKYSPTLAACVPLWTILPLAVHGFRVVSFG